MNENPLKNYIHNFVSNHEKILVILFYIVLNLVTAGSIISTSNGDNIFLSFFAFGMLLITAFVDSMGIMYSFAGEL